MSDAFHAEPGGPAVTIELGGGATAEKLSVGDMDNNAYLLTCGDAPAELIDAAAEPQRLEKLIAGRRVGTIITTHQHHDHIGALADLARATEADLVAGEPDVGAISRATGVTPRGVWDGDSIPLGNGNLDVIGLVGHTPGSITLAWTPSDGGPTHLFTGDSLFPGGPGKTNSKSDNESLLTDLTAKIFDRFGDDTVVHPGHGDATTLGAERPQLGEWRARGW